MEIPGIGLASETELVSSTFSQYKTPKAEEVKRTHFKVTRFLFQSASKLHLKPVPLATAAHVYHKFFLEHHLDDFDPYLIAATCLYLAGKLEEDHLRLRDVINVTYRTLHPDKAPLDIGATYWALRESVAQCELFILRVLKFHVSLVHPHKYLLHYLQSVLNWLPPAVVKKVPIARTAWALLRDSYHGNVCLKYPAEQLALGVLYLSLQTHGVEVPYNKEAECSWWEALVEDIKLYQVRKIIRELIDIYDLENTFVTYGGP